MLHKSFRIISTNILPCKMITRTDPVILLWQASPIVAERPLGLSKNCYYIGKNPLYATGDYRQRMEGVLVKAAIKRGQKSLLILLSVSRLGRRPRRSSSEYKDLQPRM